ncbi:MAG: 2'-5' RNA ligase [Deltaproteobacteria bacterium]|nr:MAG: 2'-5' RNA ligase [Deltaproteobacteria bacterium]
MTAQRRKYPRTPHLPWSEGATSDDITLDLASCFEGREVVVTEKMDGENTTMYTDYIHARSLDSKHHPSRNWVKQLHGRIGYNIPEGWRICGENMYAQHSIIYDDLESYFYLFSVWNEENECLDWNETIEWAELLQLPVPPVLYQGPWDEALIENLSFNPEICEGYVVRTVAGFAYTDFQKHLAKVVRANHVQTDEHWMHRPVIPNQLRDTTEAIAS